ncbi:hypothetical protein BHM03_00000651 [Ensete ventricosum]|nr:hypothetical protein BHM03_00000651 [Ensete ventricosum]
MTSSDRCLDNITSSKTASCTTKRDSVPAIILPSIVAISQPLGEQENAVTATASQRSVMILNLLSSMPSISSRFIPFTDVASNLCWCTSIHSVARGSLRLLFVEPASSSLYLLVGTCAFLCTAKLSRLHPRLRQNSIDAISLASA